MRYAGITSLLISNFLLAQTGPKNLSFYTIKDGLSNSNVLCIEKDSRGFLWLGTQEGLNRFDGYRFKKYFAEKNNKAGLPNDYILDICEYQQGRLLIATTNCLSVLNTWTGQFENEKIKNQVLQAGSGTIINSLYKDNQSAIWVNHNGELDLLDSNLNYRYRFTGLRWAKGLRGITIAQEQWYTDKHGRLWLPSDTSGIHLIDFAAQKIYNSNNNPEQLPFLKKQSIRSFAFDEENDKLLYGAWGEGLTVYDFKTGQEQKELFGIARRDEGRTINSIIKTGPGRFLFYIGAACYEITANDFQNYHLPERSIIPGYRNDLINTIILFPSGDKQYWAGTTVGLAMVDYKKPFYTELSLQQAGVGEIANCTDMIISQSGRLYCTYSSNQLVITEKNRKEFSVHSFSAKGLATITEICEDKNQNIWIGTTRGLYIYDDVTGKIKSNMFLPAGQFALNGNVLYCDDEAIYGSAPATHSVYTATMPAPVSCKK